MKVMQQCESAHMSVSMESLTVGRCKGTLAQRWGMHSLHLHLRV